MTSKKKKKNPKPSRAKAKGANGKGDAPRNLSKKFRNNYGGINWSKKKS